MNPPYDFDDIDDYLQGRMSAADKASFEQTLATDADLANQVEALRAETAVLNLMRAEALQRQFDTWEKEKQDNTGGLQVSFRRSRVLAVAAALLVCVVATGIVLRWFGPKPTDPVIVDTPQTRPDSLPLQAPDINNTSKTDEKVAQQTPPSPKPKDDRARYIAMADRYASSMNDFSGVRGSGGNATSQYGKAVEQYNQGNYLQALELLRDAEPGKKNQAAYLQGLCQYHLGKFAEAGQLFYTLGYETPDYPQQYTAQWLEILCLLKQMPATKATLMARLSAIQASDDHPKKVEAGKMVKEVGG